MADPVEVIWRPTRQQALLISCPCFEVFFGGARGGGKSDGTLGDWAAHASAHRENAIGILLRRELTQLREIIFRSKAIYGRLGGQYHETEKMWTMPGGGRLSFGYLERDSDADRYQGSSYTRVYIEELGNFPSPDPIFKLMATLRSAHGVPCGFRATGNPGGVGQSWIKQRYIDPQPLGMKRLVSTFTNPWTGDKLERDRVFIPSKVLDNPHLPADYVANLFMVGKPKLVKAWLTGDWNQVEGAYFDNFDTTRHVIRPFPLSPRWVRFRAMDWGSAKPFAVGWFVVVGDDLYLTQDDRKLFIPRGALVMFREWYGVQTDMEGAPIYNTGLKMDAEDVGSGIVALEPEGNPKYSVLDPSAFARDGGPSIAERMADKGAMFERAINARVDSLDGRTGGWNMIRHRLNGEFGQPMLFFFNTCTHTVRTLPEQQHDKSNPEDIDTEGEDHCSDMLRYACMSRPWIKSAPIDSEAEILQSREMASNGYMSDVRGGDDGAMLVNMAKLFERQERRRPRNRDIS
jgi:Terminase large subunit, T4likevirus-type, N-terminal